MKKAVITGISGFIGSNLKNYLEKRNYEVVGLARDYLFRPKALSNFLKLHRPDHIYHLSAYGNSHDQSNEQLIFDTNVVGTWNLVKAANDIPYESFISASTSLVLFYPFGGFYSASKAAGENLVNAFKIKYLKPITTVRFASIYGPGEAEHRFIPTVIHSMVHNRKLHINPSATHDYVYIDDCIDILYKIATNSKYLAQAVNNLNISTNQATSNMEIVRTLAKVSNKDVDFDTDYPKRDYEPDYWVVDNAVLTTYLKPMFTPLEEGLRQTYEYYRQKYEG